MKGPLDWIERRWCCGTCLGRFSVKPRRAHEFSILPLPLAGLSPWKTEAITRGLGGCPVPILLIFFLALNHLTHSRAYIDFSRPDDVIEFAEFFNGHVFVSKKGAQFKAIVEYAP
ncbi:hypothetical protein CASFOL_019774 [Castilleja foliolosa]|uniref:UPF3 domain-containing protein n=1 Tax=Castilleja foliolosa TaxID=1961234 RepID=A0ABD3D0G3_9LAMI